MPLIHEGTRSYEATEEEWHEHQRLLLQNALNRLSDEELGRIAYDAVYASAGEWSALKYLQNVGAAIRAKVNGCR